MTSQPQEAVAGADEAPEDNSPIVVAMRPVEIATLAIILAFAMLMAWDNWRVGARWDATGPQAGYFPFYVSLIMAGACIWGLAREIAHIGKGDWPFVRREQAKRVLQVFVPTLLFVPVTQWLGLYVASFALIAGFMYFIGRIKAWKAVVTGYVFSMIMFLVFEVAFDVIMPKGPLERYFGY